MCVMHGTSVNILFILSLIPLNGTHVIALSSCCSCLLLHIEFYAIVDLDYKVFKPSRLSAALVAATRKLVGLEPVWPSRLALATGYTVEQIEHPLTKLLR